MGVYQSKVINKYRTDPDYYKIKEKDIVNYSRFLDKLVFVHTFDNLDELKDSFKSKQVSYNTSLTKSFDLVESGYNPELRCKRFAIVVKGTKFIDNLVNFSSKVHLFHWHKLEDYVFIFPKNPRKLMNRNDYISYKQSILGLSTANNFEIHEYEIAEDYKCFEGVEVVNKNLKIAIDEIINKMVNSTLEKNYSELTNDEIIRDFTTSNDDGVIDLKYDAYPISLCPNGNGKCLYIPALRSQLTQYKKDRYDANLSGTRIEDKIRENYQDSVIPLKSVDEQLKDVKNKQMERDNIYFDDYENTEIGKLDKSLDRECALTDKYCLNEKTLEKMVELSLDNAVASFPETSLYIAHRLSSILQLYAKGIHKDYIMNVANSIRELGRVIDALELMKGTIKKPINENIKIILDRMKMQEFDYKINEDKMMEEYNIIVNQEHKMPNLWYDLINSRIHSIRMLKSQVTDILTFPM